MKRYWFSSKKHTRKYYKLYFILTSIFVSMSFQQVLADERLRQFAMYITPELNNENCELVERRISQNEQTITFSGKMDDSGCNVSISRWEYEKLFKVCFLTGINISQISNNHSFECFVQQRQDDYLFRVYLSQDVKDLNNQVMCYFSCQTK